MTDSLRPVSSPAPSRSGASSGYVFMLITMMGWGLNWPIMKHLLTEWPPLSARGLSGLVGAIVLAVIASWRRQPLRVPRALLVRLTLISLITVGAWVACIGLALVWLNAGEAAVLGSSMPVWVAVLAWPLLGERFSLRRAIALLIALSGLLVLFSANGLDAGVAKLPGVAFCLIGAMCVALGTVLTKRFPLQMPPIALAAWQTGIGCIPVALAGLVLEHPDVAALSAVGWASLAYMALVQFCVCYACWFAALERMPASTLAIGTLLVPIFGVLASALMLHEPLGMREAAALVLTLGGVTLAARS
jgi:drug/metabolite transporter (DMT)-like permease